MKKRILLSLLLASSVFASSELDDIKEQLKTQQLQLDALNKTATNQSASFSQNAYLPDMAFVLNMSAVSRDVTNSEYENYQMPGFINDDLTTQDDNAELLFNKNRGFNLNYAEIALASAVDPYFDAFAIFHLQPDGFEIEEAFVNTKSLPYGIRIKAGRFRSAFGRLNEKHQHSWSFDEQPLILKSLFGVDSLKDAGVQFQWVAPTDTYIMAGVETLQGTNDKSFGDTEPNLLVGYLKSSVDIGDDLSILGGVSIAKGKTQTNENSSVYGVDLTIREQIGSYSALVWQSEYLLRNKDINSSQTDKQAGLYTQLVYQYNNNYSAGFRYDLITKNETNLSSYATVDTDNLEKYTAMLEYKPFPMSRLRLNYSHDNSKVLAGKRQTINTVMLTLNIAAGAHGAHNY